MNHPGFDLVELEKMLGYHFQDPALLQLALTHPSVAHEKGSPHRTNQRLEFLGDAVLQMALSRELYQRFPEVEEGALTKGRAEMVNRRTLADAARGLDLGRFLIVSRGEEMSGGRARNSSLADAFEAVIGAIYLDGGMVEAEAFILRRFGDACSRTGMLPVLDNPKGELQEHLQSTSTEAPQYGVVSVRGPDHDRVFECTVRHAGEELARGQGKSKKEAESAAARAALERLRQATPKPDPGTDGPAPSPPPD